MDLLRKAFADIAAGCTHSSILGRPCYIKHLSYADQIDQDVKREEFFEEAKREGLPTNEMRLVAIRKEGKWTDAMEREIVDSKRVLEGMVSGRRTQGAKMPSMMPILLKQEREEEAKLKEKLAAKDRLLGLTCEAYADNQVSDHYVYTNLFQDKGLTTLLFEQSEFDYLSHDQMGQIIKEYNTAIEGCSELNVKKLAMQGFFQSYFGLVGDNLGQLFGKPICQLTFFQVRLLSSGALFRSIYQSANTAFPKHVMDDPDLLIEYAAAARKGKEELDKLGANDEGATVVGVKREDAAALGVKANNSIIGQMAAGGGNVIDWMTRRG